MKLLYFVFDHVEGGHIDAFKLLKETKKYWVIEQFGNKRYIRKTTKNYTTNLKDCPQLNEIVKKYLTNAKARKEEADRELLNCIQAHDAIQEGLATNKIHELLLRCEMLTVYGVRE